MSALNCDKEKALDSNRNAGHCDSKDSAFANTKTNFSTTTVDPKNDDDAVNKNPLYDDRSVVLTAGSAGSLSRISGNDIFNERLCEDSEVKFGYREQPSDRTKMDICSVSQNKPGAGVQLECNTPGRFTETADSISCSSLQKRKVISSSCDKEMINHESKSKILQSHEFSNNNKLCIGQVSEVNDLTLKTGKEDDRKVVEVVNKRSLDGGDSVEKVTLRRKHGVASAVKVGPDAELSQVLQRRSNYLSDWEVQQSSPQVFTEADRRVLEYEKKLEEEKTRRQCQLNEAMPVIVNEELSKIMNERKGVVDSLTSLDKQGDDVLNEMGKSTSIRPVLKLDSEAISVASVTGNEAGLNSEAKATAKTLNQETSMKVRCHENESLGSQITVPGADECSYKLCLDDMSKLNAEGVKVMASETLIRKSSWTPTSRSLFNPSELSPRQKTQPVTSKEVEKALQASSLSPDLILTYGAATDGDNTEDRPKARGILKTHEHEHEKTPLRGILKHRSDHREAPVKGILKTELPATEAESKNIHGILKHDSASSVTDRPHQSILKREKDSTSQLPLRGALKKDSESQGRGDNMEPEVAPSWHSKDQLLSNDLSSDNGKVEAEAGSTIFVNEFCADKKLQEGKEKKEDSDGGDKEDSGSTSVQMGDSRSARNKGDNELPSVQKGDSGLTGNKRDRGSAENKGDSELPSLQKGDSGLAGNRRDSGSTENKGDSLLPSVQKGDRGLAGNKRDSESAGNKEDSESVLVLKETSGSDGNKGNSKAAADKEDNGSAVKKGDSVSTADKRDSGLVVNKGDSRSDASMGDSGSAAKCGDSGSVASEEESESTSSQENSGSTSDEEESGSTSSEEISGSTSDQEESGSTSNQENSGSAADQEDSGSSADQGNIGSSADQEDSRSAADQGNSGSALDEGNSGSALDQGNSRSALDQGDSGSASDQGNSRSASDQGNSGSASDQGNSGSASDQGNSGSASDQGDSFVEVWDADMNSKFLRPELGRSVSHVRHLTEPTTSDARQEVESLLETPEIRAENITPKSSVSDRLAALQKSGDNWKRRREPVRDIVPGQRILPGVASNGAGVSEPTDVVRRIKLSPQPTTRPESIADRLSLLRGSQEGWKAKVTEKDTKMFTVEGKLDKHGIVMESPLQSKTDTPGKEIRPRVVKIEVTPPTDNSQKMEEPEKRTPVVVAIPTVDSKLMTEFFSTRSLVTTPETRVEVTLDDFDHIFLNSNDVLKPIQKPTPKRTKAGSRNPLKTMSQHITLQNEYREESTGIAERELKRIKKERVIGTPLLAQEALAGLASKENFSKVSLRKAESFHGTGLGDRHLPHKEIMLLHVKGRKWCQTRLVEPHYKSINSGDCYLLVTPDVVFHYVGKFSNVIERNKSSDLASQICQKHDLCVRPACELAVLDEEKLCRSKYLIRFWTLLGGNESSIGQGPGRRTDEDDWYEASINLTNRVYSFRQDQLVFVPDYSGKLLKHEMLRSTEIYVFDFGSEMYVWIGKQAVFDKRRVAVKLAFDLWQKGYDFKDDDINPLSPLVKESDGGIPASGKARPKWALFGKVNQNMETALFKEKFIDWPDATRLIKAKGRVSEGEGKADLISDLKPCDAKKMFEMRQTPVTMVLEGSHVGRGKTWEEMQDGIKWEYEIQTHDTKVWHVTEFSAQELDSSSYGHFHSDDTYVVRWHYSIHQIARTLKGKESHKTQTGRMRCVYFFWQGQHSSINEKGASALMTVELDTERGPQVQLSQGKEPPCFLNLFNSQMVVHLGKRSPESQDSTLTWKLFVVRNEMPNEVCLLEVPVAAKNLRSRTSFVLLNVKTGSAFVWHGAKSVRSVQKATMQIATNLEKRCPKEFGLAKGKVIKIEEIHEGSETKEFWSVLGGRCSRSSYGSLLDDRHSHDNTPRLFFMTSVSGTFEAKEIPNSVANDSGVASAYPFLQADLYIEEQPALFLLDNHHEVYLWQGWWPPQTADGESVHTGSAETRFNVNRKCAMETALAYSKEICASRPPPVYLVYAGCEPVEFTSLFPRWQPDERAIVSPTKGSRTNSSLELVADVLAKLTRNDYTFEELKQRPLPDGVDPLKLEMYLAENEFEIVVGMKRKDFAELQTWRQTEIKQKVGLF